MVYRPVSVIPLQALLCHILFACCAFLASVCSFVKRSLLELSLDGNPVAGGNGIGSHYRRYVLDRLSSLHHLDLKRVTGDDKFPLHSHQPPSGTSFVVKNTWELHTFYGDMMGDFLFSLVYLPVLSFLSSVFSTATRNTYQDCSVIVERSERPPPAGPQV